MCNKNFHFYSSRRIPFLKSIDRLKLRKKDRPRSPSTPASGGRSFNIQNTLRAVLFKTVIFGIVVSGTFSTDEAVVVEVRFLGLILRPKPVAIHQGNTTKLAPVSSTNFACKTIFPSK